MSDSAPGGITDPERWRRPAGVSDAVVEATGRLSEGLEYVHRVRGAIYDAHQLVGRADILFGEAADLLREAGHPDLADELDRDLVGRNLLAGRWTFQVVEEFDDGYYAAAVEGERRVREALLEGRRHVHESELKERRRTRGRAGHEQRPRDVPGSA